MFKKAFGGFFRGAKKIENRGLMEAIVGGNLLMAAADGTIEKEETQKIDRLIRSNENLKHFGSEISKTTQLFTDKLESDFEIGRSSIMRVIKGIAHNDEHVEDVMLNILAIAKSDGEIEPGERRVAEEIARELGFRLEDHHFEIRQGA